MKSTSILLLLSFLVGSESLTPQHLQVFQGEWQGTLTYLNYQDDETLVDLPVRMVATYNDEALSFEYFYDEGSGRTEKRTGSFKLKGKKVQYNGSWQLDEADITDLNTWKLALSSKGKDNNQKASFQLKVDVSPSQIVTTKWVKYEEEDGDYFMRNRHVFER
ncbi:MAG: hypothetical protein AAGA85_14060 [Bacteroidota bacterium]